MNGYIEKPQDAKVGSYVNGTLDDLFSKYIRLKHSTHQGYCKCVTCGSIKHWKDMDNGHYVRRGLWGTRFDEKNCGPQCRHCNRTIGEQAQPAFAQYLIERWGSGIIEELLESSQEICNWTLADCKELARKLRKAIKNLRPLDEVDELSKDAGACHAGSG